MLFLLPFDLPVISHIPLVRFLGDSDWMRPMALLMVLAIAALGLNLLAGVAGQVSLGHAFFMGVGACTAVYLGGRQRRGDLGPFPADLDLASRRRRRRGPGGGGRVPRWR